MAGPRPPKKTGADARSGVVERIERRWFIELAALYEVDFEYLAVSAYSVARLKPRGSEPLAPAFASLSGRCLALDWPMRRHVQGWVVRLRAAPGEPEDFHIANTVAVELALAAEDLREEARWQSVVSALAESLRRILVVLEMEPLDPGQAVDAFGLFGPRP